MGQNNITLLYVFTPSTPVNASLDLVCSLAAVCQTRRGFELDCAMHAHQHGEIAWEGLATLVSRSKATRRSGGRRTPPRVQEEVVGWCEPDLVEVAGDTGRRYAAVSGDYNPFHLHGLLARLFGFRRPIAHGMWTLARAMAWLEDQRALPERHRVQVDFKRPLLMPGRVALRQREVQAGDGERVAVEIEVRHATKQQPHLAGRVVW